MIDLTGMMGLGLGLGFGAVCNLGAGRKRCAKQQETSEDQFLCSR